MIGALGAIGTAAGIAGNVLGALPTIGKVAKGALGVGKKVVGGLKQIFGGGGIGQLAKSAQTFGQGARDLYQAGKNVYQGYKDGGIGGAISSATSQLGTVQQTIGDMAGAARDAYSTGAGIYNQTRQLGQQAYQQGRSLVQGGMDEIRRRRQQGGAMMGISQAPRLGGNPGTFSGGGFGGF